MIESVRKTIQVVADEFQLVPGDLIKKNRHKQFIVPRFLAYWMVRKITDYSLPKIAKQFRRDHTTVLHGIRRIDALLAEDPELVGTTEKLINQLIKEPNDDV